MSPMSAPTSRRRGAGKTEEATTGLTGTEGAALAKIDLNTNDLLNLKGTPLPQDASLDELRLKDLPANGAELKPVLNNV